MHRSLTILLKGDSTAELRILTNNVRGLGDQNKRRELFYWLKLHNISIACLSSRNSYHKRQIMQNFSRMGGIFI